MDQRVSLITLGTTDMDRAARFYTDMGWKQVETDDSGITVFDLVGQVLGLYPFQSLADELDIPVSQLGQGGMTLGHNVENRTSVDDLMVRAEKAGAKIIKPAQEVFWGGYHGYFADPDGHIWEIAHNPYSPLGPNGEFQWNGAA